MTEMANRLAGETSPYLLQHAHNPVDWYPWGPEALQKAKEEDKPILLSIGYSACHWCHVMERESFENEQIARSMNENFVSIKVDREERPDLDAVYMDAVQAMTGHGGWPMTVFLTPDGAPFFGGTYFPAEEGRGMMSFPRVLAGVSQAYKEQRDKVLESAAQIREFLQDSASVRSSATQPHTGILDEAARNLLKEFDRVNGGTLGAPKFPQPMNIEFMLRQYRRTGDLGLLGMAELTLQKMARGGIYDQVGGGFHRYSVDEVWLVPHFEKMLYDNALLSRVEEGASKGREKLYAVCERRLHPRRDDKVLVAWNGLMLRAFAEAASILERDDYRTIAIRNAEFVMSTLVQTGDRGPGNGDQG